MLLFMPGVRKL